VVRSVSVMTRKGSSNVPISEYGDGLAAIKVVPGGVYEVKFS
jgi:hypothetical protein